LIQACYNLQMQNQIHFGDNLPFLQNLPGNSIDLIYIDPPFNTGKLQSRRQLKTTRSDSGDRIGFGDQSYSTELIATRDYRDSFKDFRAFLEPRLLEAYRILKQSGSLYFHIDFREAHYCKILNEIIWAYDYGGRSTRKWPAKHDTIFWYAKDPEHYTFNREAIDRIPYLAPGLAGAEKAARGKLPTDTWWHTIVPTNGKEKTGYPTQKPLGILRRILRASSNPGEVVLDFFAGSGTTGAACLELDRRFILVDNNPQALEVMAQRFAAVPGIEWRGWPAD